MPSNRVIIDQGCSLLRNCHAALLSKKTGPGEKQAAQRLIEAVEPGLIDTLDTISPETLEASSTIHGVVFGSGSIALAERLHALAPKTVFLTASDWSAALAALDADRLERLMELGVSTDSAIPGIVSAIGKGQDGFEDLLIDRILPAHKLSSEAFYRLLEKNHIHGQARREQVVARLFRSQARNHPRALASYIDVRSLTDGTDGNVPGLLAAALLSGMPHHIAASEIRHMQTITAPILEAAATHHGMLTMRAAFPDIRALLFDKAEMERLHAHYWP